ncbi:MAG: hypothetical protein GY754_16855 [bacterium]|nr:hypothetical protein [bacterium]
MITKKLKCYNTWSSRIVGDVFTNSEIIEIAPDDIAVIDLAEDEEMIVYAWHEGMYEIMKITSVNTETSKISVKRAQEGTERLIYTNGDVISCRPSAGMWDYFLQKAGDSVFTYKASKSILCEHGTKPGPVDAVAVAALQSPTVPGYISLSSSPYFTPNSIPRELTISSVSDVSNVNFAISYIDESNSIKNLSIPGPNNATVFTGIWAIQVNDISVSGACTDITVGIDEGLILVDLDDGEVQSLTVDGPATVRFANICDLPAQKLENGLKLYLTAGGDHALTWEGAYKSDYGNFPPLSSDTDILVFFFQGASGERFVHHIGRKMK